MQPQICPFSSRVLTHSGLFKALRVGLFLKLHERFTTFSRAKTTDAHALTNVSSAKPQLVNLTLLPSAALSA